MVYSTFHISLQFPPLNYELIRQPVLLKVAYDFHSETFFPNKHLEQLRYESFQANLTLVYKFSICSVATFIQYFSKLVYIALITWMYSFLKIISTL